jgi:hypothetical protein
MSVLCAFRADSILQRCRFHLPLLQSSTSKASMRHLIWMILLGNKVYSREAYTVRQDAHRGVLGKDDEIELLLRSLYQLLYTRACCSTLFNMAVFVTFQGLD